MKGFAIACAASCAIHAALGTWLACGSARIAPPDRPPRKATLEVSRIRLTVEKRSSRPNAAASSASAAADAASGAPGETAAHVPVPAEARPDAVAVSEATDWEHLVKPPAERAVPREDAAERARARQKAAPPPAAALTFAGAEHAEQSDITAPARPERSIEPEYPRRARDRGEQGVVTLQIRVGTDGRVEDVTVVLSSGFPALDQAAVTAARRAQFRPAEADGHPVASTVRLPMRFQLR